MSFSFEPVPPPPEAPIDLQAQAQGLPRGLRLEPLQDQWRCAACNRMQPAGVGVGVPDSVRLGDPAWSVTEACRVNAFNGNFSMWCLPCARALGAGKVPTIVERLIAETERTRDWVWIAAFIGAALSLGMLLGLAANHYFAL